MIIFYNRKLKKNVWDDIKKKVTDFKEVSFFQTNDSENKKNLLLSSFLTSIV